ncbi:MAG: hypothetical protein F4W92_01220 [Gammaproteobacteria bacterium]|nr:hypothetical protein [Gammaproteobacteria bacterium]
MRQDIFAIAIGNNNNVVVNNDQSGDQTPTPTESQVEDSETPERKRGVSRFLPSDNSKFFVLIVMYELLNSVLSQYFAF